MDHVFNLPTLWQCAEKTAENLLLLCPKGAAECHHHFGDSTDITDVFLDYMNLVE